jgi:NADH:ubiquinone oxidoreductase subunit 6 (subunit J)
MLFYASLVLGVTFTLYGSALVGVLEIITFAGAISVMLLSAILMTGESKLDIGGSKLKLMLVLTFIGLATIGAFFLLVQVPSGTATEIGSNITTTDLFSFIWNFRPWDLLILLIVFSSAMVVVANLFSRETS